jgi:thiamine pyrophosphate-dependent acetolactate synthase large subunit-like protein
MSTCARRPLLMAPAQRAHAHAITHATDFAPATPMPVMCEAAGAGLLVVWCPEHTHATAVMHAQ